MASVLSSNALNSSSRVTFPVGLLGEQMKAIFVSAGIFIGTSNSIPRGEKTGEAPHKTVRIS